ncbi:hypothetical protein D3C86_1401970 [compost metagenome]
MRGDDRGHAGLGVEVLGVDGHAAGRDDLEGLEGLALHDHVLGRPVGASDRVLVLEALELGGLDRAGLHADLDLGDVVGALHPQVDQVDLAVAADDVEVAARGRHARDMDRVARLDDGDDLLRVPVDQGDLAAVAQGHREQVLEVELVQLLLGALGGRDDLLVGGHHLLHPELGRLGGLLHDVAGHDVDFTRSQLVGGPEVRHAARRAVGDHVLEVLVAPLAGDVGGEGLAGGALAQDPVAAGAALEEDFLAAIELLVGHARHRGRLRLGHEARREGNGRQHGNAGRQDQFPVHGAILLA